MLNSSKKLPKHPDNISGFSGPDVIVDFIFNNGLLFITLNNIGDKPAFRVSAKFDGKITGLEGTKDISSMALFRHTEFLAPAREIKVFLDSSASYFKRKDPTAIKIDIQFYDDHGNKRKRVIKHNLNIYKDIGYLRSVNNWTNEKL